MTTPQKGRIFISYRRVDTRHVAGRIYDRLALHFGEEAIFMDVEAIDGGVDFVKVLEEAVQSCDVVITLIGKQWLNIKDERGERRLENPEDFVRIEIAAALSRDIRVIPVLVDRTNMPRSTELPENLKPLARRNALQVNHQSFNADANRLISHVERALRAVEDSKVFKTREVERKRGKKIEQDREKEERRKKVAVEKVRQDRIAREKQIAEEKVRQDVLKKVRQQERVEKTKKFFSEMGKVPIYIIGGIAILFLLGYIIKNASAPVATKLTNTEIPFTLTPALGIGSTMLSEKDGMTLLYVPAGEFEMGSENGDSDEKPVHTVFLDAYWIDQTEVTNKMYAKCVFAGACDLPSESKSRTQDDYYGNVEFDNYPVESVSWGDANKYCVWADRRLPTEAEWEKASRGGLEGKEYPWGDNAPICNSGSFNGARFDDYFICGNLNTEKVGNYSANNYGIYDMAGNVWEWVSDWYAADYYANSPLSNPLGPETGSSRVLRGGSWGDPDYYLRSAKRYRYTSLNENHLVSGFRCSRSH